MRARLLVPLAGLQLGFLLLGAIGVWRAAGESQRAIDATLAQLARTVRDSHYPLTPGVMEQLRSLTGAEFALDGPLAQEVGDRPAAVQVEGIEYEAVAFALPPSHPQAGRRLAILYPASRRRAALMRAAWPVVALATFGDLIACVVTWRVGVGLVRALLAAEQSRVAVQIAHGFAHQLRNRAAGARLALEVAEGGRDGEAVAVALGELAALEGQLRKFLAFAGSDAARPHSVDIAAAVGRAVTAAQSRADHLGIALRYDPPAGRVVAVAPEPLAELLADNLVANSLDAAGPGGSVTVSLVAGTLTVRDTGPGPAADVARKWGEPFNTDKPGGVGLGVALGVRAAATLGGTLTWDRVGDVTEVRVSWPTTDGGADAGGRADR